MLKNRFVHTSVSLLFNITIGAAFTVVIVTVVALVKHHMRQFWLNKRWLLTPLYQVADKVLQIRAGAEHLGEEIPALRAVNEQLGKEIAERKKLEEELRKLSYVIEQSPSTVVITDVAGTIEYVNPRFTQLTGYTAQEAIGQSPRLLKSNQHPPIFYKELWHKILAGSEWQGEFANRKKNGELYWELASISPVRDAGGAVTHFVKVAEDITQRVRAEEQLRASLREKEVMLQEIHHRVKNNLQIISSLIDLQSASLQDPDIVRVLQNSQNRVRSMALVHERLYQTQDLARIDVAEYVAHLLDYLSQVYIDQAAAITWKIQADGVSLSLDVAIPCGLIINELVSNALKYAFPPDLDNLRDEENIICVQLGRHRAESITLLVSDNGVGLSPDVLVQNSPSLGLRLVYLLTQQLGGTLEVDRNIGTAFKIVFTEDQRDLGS